MTDHKLLNYYTEELQHLSQAFEEFAAAHPAIADKLHLNTYHTEDPHVARLIQAFALMSGQIKQLLNDNFSELSATLMACLYPHYLAPFPSCSIVHFQPEKDLASAKIVAANRCIEVHSAQDTSVCYFTTAYPTVLLPIELTATKLSVATKETEYLFEKSASRSALTLVLETYDPSLNFNQFDFSHLRFFMTAPKISGYKLYDLLFFNAIDVIGYAGQNKLFQMPAKTCLKPVGFSRDESMLAYSDRSSLGYALLTEFFAYPEKFLFFDLCFNPAMRQQLAYNKITLSITFTKREEQLEPYLSKNYLALHCSPMINLFKKTAEPIPLDYTCSEYPIVPDLDRSKKTEVYQVRKATMIDKENNEHECHSFFSINHSHQQPNSQKYFWQLHQRNGLGNDEQNKTAISLIDSTLQKTSAVDRVLVLDLLCTNGNLPNQLALSGSKLHLQCQEGKLPVETITSISNLTSRKQWPSQAENYWRLISHLNLNQLSLFDNHEACSVLKKVLHLYDFMNEKDSHQLIHSIKNMVCEKILLRDPSGALNAFIQGLKIKLFIALPALAGHSLFLFGSILDYFFSLNCTLNSFTQLEICDEHNKEIHTWQPRSGSKVII